MSYARFSNADVYVFMSTSGYLECCGCILQDREWVDDPNAIMGGYSKPVGEIVESRFSDTQGMVDHLARHRAAGHHVPDGIEANLWADDHENWVDYQRCAVDGCDTRVTCGSPLPDGGYVSACSIAHGQSLGGFTNFPAMNGA